MFSASGPDFNNLDIDRLIWCESNIYFIIINFICISSCLLGELWVTSRPCQKIWFGGSAGSMSVQFSLPRSPISLRVPQINSAVKSSFFQDLLPMCRPISHPKTRLDYCDSLYVGLEKSSLHWLQMVQNAAAHLLTRPKKRQHVSPVLASPLTSCSL